MQMSRLFGACDCEIIYLSNCLYIIYVYDPPPPSTHYPPTHAPVETCLSQPITQSIHVHVETCLELFITHSLPITAFTPVQTCLSQPITPSTRV